MINKGAPLKVSSSCSNNGIYYVSRDKHPVLSHEHGKKEGIVTRQTEHNNLLVN